MGRRDLDGRVALITGSTRGIGRAIAEAFAGAGAIVVVNGRTAEAVDQAAGEIPKAISVPGDIATSEGVEQVFRQTLQACGRLDILVNNASISALYKPAEDITDDEWDAHMTLNLRSAFLCARAAGRHMKERGEGGCIINMSSVLGSTALARVLPYSVTKAGIDQLTRNLAIEWAPYDIRVNAIAPAFIVTDMTRRLLEHPRYGPPLQQRTPMARFGQPEDVTGAALYLASDAASYVTGHILNVDGGWTAV